jgi:trigger factor
MSDYTHKVIKHDSTKRELEVTVPYELFLKEKESHIKSMGKNVKVPGFRPGKAPKNILETVLGEKLIEESLEHLLSEITYEIITEEKLSPVSRVKYDLKKMEKDKDIEYTATFHNFPEFKLPDFRKLDVKPEEVKVEEKEVDEVMESFYRDVEKLDKKEKFDISKVTDKWVEDRKLGEAKNVSELREIMEKNIKQQKEYNSEDKLLSDLIDKALEKSKIDVPKEFIEGETKMKELQDKKKIEDLGLKWEDWLRQQKTTEEELKKKWEADSKKIYERDFLIMAVAKEHNIEVKKEEIEAMLQIYSAQRQMTADEQENLKLQLTNDMTRRKSLEKILELYKGGNKDKK